MQRESCGLLLLDSEEFLLYIGPHSIYPPIVEVDHDRFLGFPHVLQGRRLCIYLDPSREWNPRQGFASSIDRLYDWLTDAAAGRFDGEVALYHAVGGVLHRTGGAPTVVVRESGRTTTAQSAFLAVRGLTRHDLYYRRTAQHQQQTFVFNVAHPLPLGAGLTLLGLLAILDRNGKGALSNRNRNPQSPGFLTALTAAATRNPTDTPQTFVLSVSHCQPDHMLAIMRV
jgi:hypothetical protein